MAPIDYRPSVLGSATTPDLHGSNNNNNNDLLNQWAEGEAKVRRVGRMQASIGPSVAESPSKDDVGREMLRVAPPVPSISGWAPVVPASTARTSPRVRKAQPGPILPGSFTRRFIAVKKRKKEGSTQGHVTQTRRFAHRHERGKKGQRRCQYRWLLALSADMRQGAPRIGLNIGRSTEGSTGDSPHSEGTTRALLGRTRTWKAGTILSPAGIQCDEWNLGRLQWSTGSGEKSRNERPRMVVFVSFLDVSYLELPDQ